MKLFHRGYHCALKNEYNTGQLEPDLCWPQTVRECTMPGTPSSPDLVRVIRDSQPSEHAMLCCFVFKKKLLRLLIVGEDSAWIKNCNFVQVQISAHSSPANIGHNQLMRKPLSMERQFYHSI